MAVPGSSDRKEDAWDNRKGGSGIAVLVEERRGLFSGTPGQQIDMRDKWHRLVAELMANLPEKEKPTIDAPFCGKHDDKGKVLERTHRDYHSRGTLSRASWLTGIVP